MSDMYEVVGWQSPELEATVGRGLGAFGVPEPKTLEAWARENFYLSKESSYVEQNWVPWPFQRAILACIGNDDIRDLDFMKSARVGYTKMLLAAIGYFAEHKRRNQVLWQPTDGDSDEFVKTELDTMLRDVKVMERAMPAHVSRNKDNTLAQKKFLGCLLHTRGGTAARAYRRISVDVAYLDELDAFLRDIDKEGSPDILARKRVEGATFPKFVTGSTPKLGGFSLIEDRYNAADERFAYAIPCPECGGFHKLAWGKKDDTTGFKWVDGDPATVRHLCPHCSALIDQGQYLAVADLGRWQNVDGSMTIDFDGVFRNGAGQVVTPPAHIAFHVWTAYSPAVNWASIVQDFMEAYEKAQSGDITKLKAFTNTTLGETWALDVEKTEADTLKDRAEPYKFDTVPMGGLQLLAGCDTQPNRIELTVWAYGRGCEKWLVDHEVCYGNPEEDQVWEDVAEYLFDKEFAHASGKRLKIYASAIDTGGHNTQAVYNFVQTSAQKGHRIFAVKGRSGREKHIKDGASKVDIDWRGKKRKKGMILWQVGTNLAKDLIYGRLQITRPGPGYVHFSKDASDEFFKQMAGEARVERATAGGRESRWTALRKRVEAWDCTVYTVWLETHLELGKKKAVYWEQLEALVQPAIVDLFAGPMTIEEPAPVVVPQAPAKQEPAAAPVAKPADQPRRTGSSGFASDDWMGRGFS
ncbi:phage terminase large subunit family protein [Pseudoduganella albidiflava]|uniref:Terminase n=2 Tax=Pseudoduganella albidiflava TaxID=321983 RepID=A0AA88C9A9_9BURK|nr:terminase gpA endonuclease subunit [Pseudoduganella albidiflava]GGY67953.1 terminase [Pseudoduganella albidiflava]